MSHDTAGTSSKRGFNSATLIQPKVGSKLERTRSTLWRSHDSDFAKSALMEPAHSAKLRADGSIDRMRFVSERFAYPHPSTVEEPHLPKVVELRGFRVDRAQNNGLRFLPRPRRRSVVPGENYGPRGRRSTTKSIAARTAGASHRVEG